MKPNLLKIASAGSDFRYARNRFDASASLLSRKTATG